MQRFVRASESIFSQAENGHVDLNARVQIAARKIVDEPNDERNEDEIEEEGSEGTFFEAGREIFEETHGAR